jgi:hypothetical protein
VVVSVVVHSCQVVVDSVDLVLVGLPTRRDEEVCQPEERGREENDVKRTS